MARDVRIVWSKPRRLTCSSVTREPEIHPDGFMSRWPIESHAACATGSSDRLNVLLYDGVGSTA